MRKNEGTITVRTIYIMLGYQYAPPTRVRLSFWVNTGLCLLAGVIAQPVAIAQQIVTNARPAAQVLAAAAERRVDIALIGDSTTVYAGHGWDHGFSYACDQRFGLYATGIHSAGENAGQGGGIGYYSRTMHSNGATTGTFQYGGATGPQGDALGPTFAPQHYLFAPPGRAVNSLLSNGLRIDSGGPWNPSAALVFHYSYGVYSSPPAGTFTPVVRLGYAPTYQTITPVVEVSTSGGDGIAAGSISLPAASRGDSLEFRWNQAGVRTVRGPFLGLHMRMERPTIDRGASISSFFYRGGFSTRGIAAALQEAPDATIIERLVRLRQLQPATKLVLFRISTGVNDRFELGASRGPQAFLPGYSANAFKENTEVIIDRVSSVWVAQGWPIEELRFLLTASMPLETPEDIQLDGYREKLDEIARERANVSAVRMDRLTSEAELTARGWYQTPDDHFHFKQVAFEAMALREIDAIASARCLPDVNQNGGIDGGDVEAFFGLWSLSDTLADFNEDGGIDGTDVEVFFIAWQAGEC